MGLDEGIEAAFGCVCCDTWLLWIVYLGRYLVGLGLVTR